MNQTVARVLWILAGVLLIIAGVICLVNPGAAWTTLSLYLGISMLISGVIDIVVFARGSRYMVGSGWFLLDGILTVLLSLFLLFHQAFTMLPLPFIFGMWLLCSGVSKFVNSFELKRLGVPGWGWFTALGILLAVVGFFSFWDPVSQLFALSFLVGILLIFQGVSSILRACFTRRFWRL